MRGGKLKNSERPAKIFRPENICLRLFWVSSGLQKSLSRALFLVSSMFPLCPELVSPHFPRLASQSFSVFFKGTGWK